MPETPKILVVDDCPENVDLLFALLTAEGYEVVTASNGKRGLDKVHSARPDLILLDVVMPGMNGFEVCKQIKQDESTRFIPVVMVTALSDLDDKIRGIEVGADDFLIKPINKMEMLARVKSLLRGKRLHDQLDNAESVIYTLALAIEAKDPYTEGHTERVGQLAAKLAERLGLSREHQQTLKHAGVLHDIGKIGVKESILLKPGPLSSEEFDEMKDHAALGERICRPLRLANLLLPIIRHHHERWDGNGYPDRLKGADIPIGARIMAIVDAYEAMTSDRPYRRKMPKGRAISILRAEAGRQWDPEIIEVFLELLQSAKIGVDTADAVPLAESRPAKLRRRTPRTLPETKAS